MLGREDGLELERRLLHPDLLSSDTLFGQARGTPGYMAPEQIEKDNERDARTDVYGLGCILYSILTLQRPLDGEAEAVLENAKLGAITPPSRPNTTAPPSSRKALPANSLRKLAGRCSGRSDEELAKVV